MMTATKPVRKWPQIGGPKGVHLDECNRLMLDQVIRCFNSPISEEQAWAVIYQTVKTLANLLQGSKSTQDVNIYQVGHSREILIHLDGVVADETFLSKGLSRTKVTSENKALSELGVTIYEALDQGLAEQQERQLSEPLESILNEMVNFSDNQEDEGIGSDFEVAIKLSGSCKVVMESCRTRIAVGREADGHFRAVCRALVSEALELSTFIEKVSKKETESGEELNELALQDWAQLWVQVLKDLRTGAKLKHVNYTKTPVEFEMTPYEILMDDIRAQKFTLNKVMVNGELPHNVKSDAHDVILEFIRSRPPLKPVAERELKPQRKESTPVELLMDSIRGSTARTSLRKTNGPELKSLRARLGYETSRCQDFDRRKVTLDENLMENLLNFSDDEDENEPKMFSRRTSIDSTNAEDPPSEKTKPSSVKKHRRRHSLTVCETPSATKQKEEIVEDEEIERNLRYRAYKNQMNRKPRRPTPKVIYTTQFSTTSTVASSDRSRSPSPSTSSSSRASSTSSVRERSKKDTYKLNTPQMHATLHSEFLQSDQWATALQTLDLTLDEVVHIRSVLTMAEMEGLPLDGTLKDDVANGKVCFLCMKTRFGFFNRGCKCRLCKQRVCSRCSTKMHISLEQFSTTPVFTLEPNAVHGREEVSRKQAKKSSSFRDRMSEIPSFFRSAVTEEPASVPNSPKQQRTNLQSSQLMTSSLTSFSGIEEDDEYDNVLVGSVTNLASGTTTLGRNFGRKKSRQELMSICVDCKEMVLQVIRAQSTARRLQLAKSLFTGQHKPPQTSA